MNVHPRKLDRLKKRLQYSLSSNDLEIQRSLVTAISQDLGVDTLDFAAALLRISHPHLLQAVPPGSESPPPTESTLPTYKSKYAQNRTVRYRIDVGHQHGVDDGDILAVLVDESGVDKKRVTRLDIRDYYTLVDLPEGMPADIFHLLTEACVKGHRLNIKRLKPNRKKIRQAR